AAYYAQLGGLLGSSGDSPRVESALRTAFELDPCEPNFAGLLANFMRERNRLDGGISVARQGLECSPDAENLHLELGHLRARAGDITGAEQAFRRAHELNARSAWPVLALTELFEQQGRAAEAAATLEGALQSDPDNPRLLQRYVPVLSAMG